MNEILKRIRIVFRESGKSQTEIGKLIGKTPQYVWRLLNVDDINPSNSTIEDICRKLSINEEWLRNGKEPMNLPASAKFSSYLGEISAGDDYLIQDIIEIYMGLDQQSKDALRVIADKFAEKRIGRKERE